MVVFQPLMQSSGGFHKQFIRVQVGGDILTDAGNQAQAFGAFDLALETLGIFHRSGNQVGRQTEEP